MDKRAQDILDAGRAIVPQLPALVGDRAEALERELMEAVAAAQAPWQAELVREILLRNPTTQAFLEARVPESRDPRPFEGGSASRAP